MPIFHSTACFSTSKIKPEFLSEILVPFYQTTWQPILEDHGHTTFVLVSLVQTHMSVGTEQRYLKRQHASTGDQLLTGQCITAT